MILEIINRDFDKLLMQLTVVFLAWIIVILAIGIDLYFGIQKSKKLQVYTHSYGLRKTSEKTVQYLAFMFFMLFLDILNPMWVYLKYTALPIASLFGAIVLVYTEWKSVKEKSEEKFRKSLATNPIEIINFIKDNRRLIREIMEHQEHQEHPNSEEPENPEEL